MVRSPTEAMCSQESAQAEQQPKAELSFTQTHLMVRDIMNPQVVTASPKENVLTAAKRMSQHHVSCVVVVSEGAVVGILTQRDLLSGVAQEQPGYRQLPIAERMSSPTIVAPPDLPVLEAGRLLETRHIKHLPVVTEQRLIGLVTQTDITRGLVYLTPLQRVSEVMSSRIATVEPEATAADAARTMWTRKITGVVVMHGDEAIGIVSQKDILVRVLSMQKNATRTPVTDIMSTPVLPIPPDYSVFMASRLMHRMRVHRLVVQDGRLITGIVSQTDILRAVERRLGEEETHRLFLVSSDIPIFMLDPRAVVTYVNAAVLRLFDFDGQAAIVGHALADARFWQSPADQQRLEAVLRREEPAILGLALRTDAGQTRRVVLLLIVSRDACDEVQSWQGVLWHASDSRKPPVGRWPLPDMRAGSTR